MASSEHLDRISTLSSVYTEQRFLVFFLSGEKYGIEVLKVREIIGLIPITPVPQIPGFIKGVINLRGRIIPIIDLKIKLGLSDGQRNERNCIIVVSVDHLESDSLIGLLVDSVAEVLILKADEIVNTPTFGVSVDTQFIYGLAKKENRVIILLDIDWILVEQEISILREMQTAPPVPV